MADLDQRVDALLSQSPAEVKTRHDKVCAEMEDLQAQVSQLREDIDKLGSVMPLPLDWEAKLPRAGDHIEFHDHKNKRATYQRPDAPPPGEPCVRVHELPQVMRRLGTIIQCADRWWRLQGEERCLGILLRHFEIIQEDRKQQQIAEQTVRQDLEISLIGSAHLVF